VDVEFSKLCLSMIWDLKGPLIKYFISGPFLIVSCSPAIDKIVAN
jgi:hypothetical protein